jgi:hypothetical protein
MGATSPDNIYMLDKSGSASLVQESQTQGATIQAAFNKRQRYDFVWPTSAERGVQTGMAQGSRGYQVDTKSEYLFDGGNWRLAIPHAEYTATKTIPNAGSASTAVGTFSQDSSHTTDTGFSTATSDGTITLANPGLYSFSANVDFGTPTITARFFVELTTSSGSIYLARAVGNSDTFISVALPNLFLEVSNFQITLGAYQASGSSRSGVASRLRVTRLG